MFARLLKLLVLILLVAMLALGGFAALNWQPDRPVSELKPRWAPPPSTFVDVGGISVHVRDEGPRDSDTTIVLLHGTSASLHTWDGWGEALKPRYRVVRFTMPGSGLTGPNAEHDYRIARYVDFVVSTLDVLGIERSVLVGNSLGGHVAWTTAVLHPSRVAQLVLIDASGYPRAPRSVPIGFRLASMPALQPFLRDVLPRSFVRSSLENVYGDPSKVSDALVDRYFDLTTRAGNRDALVARMSQLETAWLSERIPEIRQPTLILWGARDELIPIESAYRFEAEIPDAELVVFDDLGHVPHEEDPARTVAAFIDFLERRIPSQ